MVLDTTLQMIINTTYQTVEIKCLNYSLNNCIPTR